MTQSCITKVTITVTVEPSGFLVQHDVRYFKSDMSGGKIHTATDRYAHLSTTEMTQLIEDLAHEHTVGEEYWRAAELLLH